MKNYFFNPHDYGGHFTVLASSKEEALKSLQAYMKTIKYWRRKDWKNATVDNLPNEFTIEVYEEGEVVRGENA